MVGVVDNKVREVALIDNQCDAITCFVASCPAQDHRRRHQAARLPL